jgi:predicted regulator of Ras-like GTPase activity (Roadblock/LC7/MglB family)
MSQQEYGLSVFGEILAGIISEIPQAHSAIIVDYECEMIDAVGNQARLDLALPAAHWGTLQLMLQRRFAELGFGQARSIEARFGEHNITLAAISAEYFVVVLLGPLANLAHAAYLLRRALPRLLEQM